MIAAFLFAGDRIVCERVYFDSATILRQLGLIPDLTLDRVEAPPSRLGSARQWLADLLTSTFGPGRQVIWPGYQITEMGLAKLYRASSDFQTYAAALSASRYLQSVADQGADGFKVFHHEPGGEELYYLS